MKQLLCSTVSGKWDCNFVATGETDEEVKERLMQHGQEMHREMIEALTPEQRTAMEQKMEQLLAEQRTP